jgi:hypothetical protein
MAAGVVAVPHHTPEGLTQAERESGLNLDDLGLGLEPRVDG